MRYHAATKSIRQVVALFVVSAVFLTTSTVWAATTTPSGLDIRINTTSDVTVLELNQQIKDRKQKIADIRKQVATYESNIKARQSETASLENQMIIIDDEVAKTALDIEATEDEIAQIDLEAQQVDLDILEKEKEILLQKERLAEYIREVYSNDQRDFLEILLLNDRFSDFYDQVRYLDIAQGEMNRALGTIKLLKDTLIAQRNGLENSRKRQEELRTSLEQRKVDLEERRALKQSLIAQSIMSTARFESLLSQSRSEQSQIDSDLSSLESTVRQKLNVNSGGKVSLGWPVDPSRGITAYFHDPGYPFRYVFEHPAIDVRAYQGTQVKAAEAGYVVRVKDAGMGYSYVMILHDRGLATVYGHLSALFATQDTYVRKGQVIGLSGATPGTRGAGPLTTGPHLHFEVRLNGIPVDPLKYLP